MPLSIGPSRLHVTVVGLVSTSVFMYDVGKSTPRSASPGTEVGRASKSSPTAMLPVSVLPCSTCCRFCRYHPSCRRRPTLLGLCRRCCPKKLF